VMDLMLGTRLETVQFFKSLTRGSSRNFSRALLGIVRSISSVGIGVCVDQI
jgi:hypothetical protein